MYKQWKKSLKLEPFEREYLKRYGNLPCYEKDYDLVNQRMDEIWKDMRMTKEDINEGINNRSFFRNGKRYGKNIKPKGI